MWEDSHVDVGHNDVVKVPFAFVGEKQVGHPDFARVVESQVLHPTWWGKKNRINLIEHLDKNKKNRR